MKISTFAFHFSIPILFIYFFSPGTKPPLSWAHFCYGLVVTDELLPRAEVTAETEPGPQGKLQARGWVSARDGLSSGFGQFIADLNFVLPSYFLSLHTQEKRTHQPACPKDLEVTACWLSTWLGTFKRSQTFNHQKQNSCVTWQLVLEMS